MALRTSERPPSQPIRYWARISTPSPESRSDAWTVTPASCCSKPVNSVWFRMVMPPVRRAVSNSTGSRKIWLIRCAGSGVGQAPSGPDRSVYRSRRQGIWMRISS